MLLRPAHLGRANAFALLRLLPMSDRDTDVELLTLRHRLSVPERQLGEEKVGFSPSDRAFPVALPYRLPGRTDDVLGKDDVAGRGGRRGSTSRLRQGGGQGAGRCQDGARAAESAV
ncbi:hypothetical protein ACFYY3_30015 [Streptomyces sp. NPDC001812]|uniref:hypothetical protein n=1 Tax=Streptomyces sp. NPDC001812 TaxID=3364611 RepID=UPI0036A5EC30